MDASELAGLDSADAQTVCEALGRYEDTLRDAVREIHVDINVFKKGVERRMEDTLHLVSPLSRSVSELQQENRLLRAQLEALARQVDLLTGAACLGHTAAAGERNGSTAPHSPRSPTSPGASHSPCSPPPAPSCAATARYSSRATFAVSSKTNLRFLYRASAPPGLRGEDSTAPVHSGASTRLGAAVLGARKRLISPFHQRYLYLGGSCMGYTLLGMPATPSSPASEPSPSRVLKPRWLEFQFRLSNNALTLLGTGNTGRSIDREETTEPERVADSNTAVVENGHQLPPERARVSQEVTSSPVSSSVPQVHALSVSMLKPHLPITAVTKTADTSVAGATKTPPTTPGETPPPPVTKAEAVSQSATSNSQKEVGAELISQSGFVGTVKTWSPSPVRTMSSALTPDKPNSVAKPVPSVSYSTSGTPTSKASGFDGYHDMTPKPGSPPVLPRQVERRRELVRSQTLPRTMGAQTRKGMFEKLESNTNRASVGDSKPKLKRSQSFGVSSANNIKQILLEWCRSKTIGYQNIDIQNFSSSWSDGMAFCALVHSFFPEEFDYSTLNPANRKENFELAFTKAEDLANCDRLIEVEDMLLMGRKPDPMCVFTYVQSLYNHLRRFE
ncbi:SMTL2 protein, partial [Polyodon spathula]|nr:SMTL2 protein [Polyodon spathula]